jgi:hypothetical protein
MNFEICFQASTDTRTSEHTVTTTDDRSAKHYDDNTISQTRHIDQTSFAKTHDFTIFKNSHFSHVMDKSEFTHQQSQFEQENERKRNEERNNHMRKPLHAVDPQPTVQTEDYAIDDDFQNTFQIPSTSKFSQLNDQVGFCLISFGLYVLKFVFSSLDTIVDS